MLGYLTGEGGFGLCKDKFLIFFMGVLSTSIEVSQSMVVELGVGSS